MRLCLLITMLSLTGCMSLHDMKRAREQSYLTPPPTLPRELQKTTLPDYIIEPPDILRIEAIRTIPKSPYLLTAGDGLLVQISMENGELLLNEVLRVELDGSLQFGSPIDEPNEETDPELRVEGPLNVMGLSVEDARREIQKHVKKTYLSPSVRVSLNDFAAQQQITGEHLVAPDGMVNLGTYGRVRVAGLTLDEARREIELHLSDKLQNPEVLVDVFAYNSKSYYIILQGAGFGDRALNFPVTGNETVLDALTNVEGLSSTSSNTIWVARPGRNAFEGHQILPVNWPAITQMGDTTTNYQLLPGDRLFVAEDRLVAFDSKFGKILAPVERLFSIVLLGTSTVSRLEFYQQQGQNPGFGGGGGGF